MARPVDLLPEEVEALKARAIVTVAALVAVTLVPVTSRSAETCWRYRRAETSLAERINGVRARHGKPRLRLDPQLSRVSRVHTADMIDVRAIFHTAASTLAARVTNWDELGENVGRAGRVRGLMRAMMRSPAHRANILNGKYTYVGVGTNRAGGRLWATVTFEARSDPGTTLSMPSCR